MRYRISGLIAYLPGAQEAGGAYIDADNSLTTKILYRLGFFDGKI